MHAGRHQPATGRPASLDPIHELLNKWRHFAYAELKDPGSYFMVLARATRKLADGRNQPSLPTESGP